MFGASIACDAERVEILIFVYDRRVEFGLAWSYATWYYLLFLYLIMAGLPHTMPESDEEVQRLVEEVFGFKPCLWQILVVRAVLAGEDVITVAPTGSGKSLTYWIPLLYIKHSITVVISPLKLLGTQFAQMLAVNRISAISITAANATNELFEVIILIVNLSGFSDHERTEYHA